LFHRHFSLYLLVTYSLFCLACLSWAADPLIRTAKYTFYYLISPTTVPVLSELDQWGSLGRNARRLLELDKEYREMESYWQRDQIDRKRFEELESENQRLTALLNLPLRRDYSRLISRVLARDSSDWFHSLLIARGQVDGVNPLDPVVALQEGREVLVGRVVEVYSGSSRVLLVTDPLSSVSARASRGEELGAVEGEGTYKLKMNYLFSDSDVVPGDEVVTAGLGDVFPEGIFLGVVEKVERESRESFKWARLRPAVRLNKLREVFVLRRESEEGAEDLARVRDLYSSSRASKEKKPGPVSGQKRP
jgi:rod shape-determining protein MreC